MRPPNDREQLIRHFAPLLLEQARSELVAYGRGGVSITMFDRYRQTIVGQSEDTRFWQDVVNTAAGLASQPR